MEIKKFFKSIFIIAIFILIFFMAEMAVVGGASLYYKIANVEMPWKDFIEAGTPVFTFLVQILRLLLVGIYIYFRRGRFSKKYDEDYIYNRRARNNEFPNIALLALGLLGFSTILTFILSFFPVFMESINSLNQNYESFYNFPVLGFLSIVVLAPLMEELALRGVLFRELEVQLGVWPAAILNAAIFGVLHFNLIQGSYAFIAGLFLSLIYKKSGSIEKVIYIHLVNNLTSYVLSNFQEISPGILLVALAAYFYSAYYLIKYLRGPEDNYD